MTEREKLRELIYAWECEENKVSIADCDTDKSFERLIDKLLANGVIVPPCKVGDTIYLPLIHANCVASFVIVHIGIWEEERVVYDDIDNEWDFDSFGKTVFLTREEAEKALEGKT